MIDLKIGVNARKFNSIDEIDERWINQHTNPSKNGGNLVCIRVLIEEGSVNLILATQGCASSGRGSRLPNRDESRLFDLWTEMKLDGREFQPEKLIAFFKRARNIIG